MTQTYNEHEVNALLEQLLALRASGPVYSATVKNGQLSYLTCIPGHHNIVTEDGQTYRVTASDETVVVGVNTVNGATRVFYTHQIAEGGAYRIVATEPLPIHDAAESLDNAPGIGAIYTHVENGVPYLVYSYTNEGARPENAEKYPVLVHYIGQNGKTWSKTIRRFNETMKVGGKFQFHEDCGFRYMGIVENSRLVGGYMTREIEKYVTEAKQ